MITVYPIEIEAVDEENTLMFRLKTFDENCAILKTDIEISNSNVDSFCQALKDSVAMLNLKKLEISNG